MENDRSLEIFFLLGEKIDGDSRFSKDLISRAIDYTVGIAYSQFYRDFRRRFFRISWTNFLLIHLSKENCNFLPPFLPRKESDSKSKF